MSIRRRARKQKKVTRKTNSMRRRFRNLEKNLHDPILRSKWNNRKSVTENFKNVSITDYLQKIPETFTHSSAALNEQDSSIVKQLIEKHDHNYQAMENDIKINYWQWGEKKCQKLVSIYENSL